MRLNVQKRVAAQILKTSKHNIRFDPTRLDDVKEAITKADVKALISDGTIFAKLSKAPSKVRARKRKIQKRKGRLKGFGRRKGKVTARLTRKRRWMEKIKVQRAFLKTLRDKKIIGANTYRKLYLKAKGGFFRSKRHIKLYIEEYNLGKKK